MVVVGFCSFLVRQRFGVFSLSGCAGTVAEEL